MKFHLAQINIAKFKEPMDSPLLADFVSEVDRINELAAQSQGFVWRFDEENDKIFDPNYYIVNMSIWESIDDLKNYAFRSDHVEVYIKRAKWFDKMDMPHAGMWWIEVGTKVDPQEGKKRLRSILDNGDTSYAFTFRNIFPKPI